MIRLATGDLSAVIDAPSLCGRTNMRIKGWMGRAEQSTKVKVFLLLQNKYKLINTFLKYLKQGLL